MERNAHSVGGRSNKGGKIGVGGHEKGARKRRCGQACWKEPTCRKADGVARAGGFGGKKGNNVEARGGWETTKDDNGK